MKDVTGVFLESTEAPPVAAAPPPDEIPLPAAPMPSGVGARAASLVALAPTTQILALIVILALASGALGAFLSARLLRPTAVPVRVGVINLTRLTRAITTAATTDPTAPAGFAALFTDAVKRLAEAEPGLVLFVKEAVIDTGHLEDYTDVILPLFTHTPSRPAPPPRADLPDRSGGEELPAAAQSED